MTKPTVAAKVVETLAQAGVRRTAELSATHSTASWTRSAVTTPSSGSTSATRRLAPSPRAPRLNSTGNWRFAPGAAGRGACT